MNSKRLAPFYTPEMRKVLKSDHISILKTLIQINETKCHEVGITLIKTLFNISTFDEWIKLYALKVERMKWEKGFPEAVVQEEMTTTEESYIVEEEMTKKMKKDLNLERRIFRYLKMTKTIQKLRVYLIRSQLILEWRDSMSIVSVVVEEVIRNVNTVSPAVWFITRNVRYQLIERGKDQEKKATAEGTKK
jgi:hypothetical protein